MDSAVTMRQLALIRYLYQRGIEQAAAPEPLGTLGLLSLHDAIELFLFHAAVEVQASGKTNEIADYFVAIDAKIGPASLQGRKGVESLNKARVNLKHASNLPSRYDLERHVSTATSFFTENTPIVFKVEFDAISLVGLVQNPKVKAALEQAITHRGGNRFKEAIESIAVALTIEVQSRSIRRHRWGLPHLYLEGEDRRTLQDAFNKVYQELAEIDEELELVGYGIDMRRLTIFRAIAPLISLNSSTPYAYREGRGAGTLEEVEFCYDFAIDTILHLQELHLRSEAALSRVDPRVLRM